MQAPFQTTSAGAIRPPRWTRARIDLAAATGLVLWVIVSDQPGIGLALLLGVALLAGRASWLAVAAARRRRVTQAAGRQPARLARRRAPTIPQRILRVLTMGALLIMVPAGVSYVSAITARSDSSLGIRSVEWFRDNGAASIVSSVEGWYYTFTAPAKGGPGLHTLPAAGVAGASAEGAYHPPAVAPAIHPALPGEGLWRPTRARSAHGGASPVLETTFRPDPSYPRVVAGLAWIDPRRARIALYPGLQEPPAPGPRGGAEVPWQLRQRLVATFNSGFKYSDGHGGFFAGARLLQPLQAGLGTIVGNSDGSVDVRTWRGGARPGPGVTFARQNLPLIVDGGRPNPNLSDGPEWGQTLGNAVLVWRSGLGVDRRGDLIYAAANDQSVSGLAHILMRAGAVRAVQLDINSYWVSFNSYAQSGAQMPRKLLPDISRPSARYLTPDDRDFFAVYSR